jgi:phage head maturation protease
MHFYGNIRKVDAEQRLVWGYASTEATDVQGETILKSAVESALDDYMEFANLREMHQLSAVGTTEEASVDDKGLYICAKVVDDTAWGKVVSGTYKGFSIGGKTLARDPKNKKIITKILLTEISLVDRPSNPEARFDVWKAAGLSVDPAEAAQAAVDRLERVLKGNSSDAIMKIIQAKDTEIDRLNKRIEDLLAEPMPPKTAGAGGYFALDKADDAGGAGAFQRQPSEDDIAKALGAMSEEDRALLLIKASRQLPRPVTMVAT